MHIMNNIPRIVYGCGAIISAGTEIKRLHCKKAFIVTDPGIASLGLLKSLEASLTDANIDYAIFAEAELEPSSQSIQRCADAGKTFGADCVIGIGGGSALDTAKAAIVLLTNLGVIDDYFGINAVPVPCVPSMLIPTAAGTGSEATSISVLTNPETGAKQGVVSDHLYAKVILLDPELTTGLPPHVTAATGIDAFVHAMESYVGLAATPFTDALNLQAMTLISANLRKAYANGNDKSARTAMLYAATLAGIGFSQTQNGIIHAVGTSLPSSYKLPHGLVMASLAPMGMSYNTIAAPEKYAVIANLLGVKNQHTALETAKAGVSAFRELLADINIAPGLAALGIAREDLEGTAQRAAKAKRLIDNNPRKANAQQILTLLQEHY